jgi:hypothetical protein
MFSIGPNGLRGLADRIVQNAEQKALDRPSNNNNRADGTTTKTTTTTISRTYINTMGSNYAYIDPDTATSVRNPVNQPPPSSSSYQTLSNTYRSIPIRDETTRNSPSWESTARDYNLRDNVIRDHSSRNSTIHDHSSRGSTTRNSSVRDSRSSSRESLVRENTGNENPQNPEYETILSE